jgi:hypothetical protein
MRRTASRIEEDSTHISPFKLEFDAESSIRSLQERVAKLESIVAELSATRDDDLDTVPKEERKRPGPKPIHRGMILSDRDQLVEMLEYYWPEIEPLCSPEPNGKGLKKVLSSITGQMQGRYRFPSIHLLRHLSKVLEFLSTDRFRRDPRQIANAFAGVPKIGVWRSLKICQESPSNRVIGNRAIRSYIRRKHPELHGRLTADYSLPNFAAAMRTYRTQDVKLNAIGAHFLYISWKQCEADYRILGLNPIEFITQKAAHGD